MAQLTDFERVRRRRAKRRTVRNLLALAIFALFVFLCVLLIRRMGDVNLKTAYSDIKAEISTGSGYPVTLPDSKIKHFDVSGEILALLSDTNIYTYNSSGKQLMRLQHGMVNQTMLTSHDRILLYDRGGTKLSLLSKTGLTQSLTTNYMIYSADLAQNGNFAVATGSNQYLSQVTVYNKNAGEIFKWYSSEKPVISVSLSDTKDVMAVGCVDVSEGSYQSSISRFQFSIDKEMNRADLPGELLLTTDYWSGTIRAITDKRVVMFNGDLKEIASYEFGEHKLNRFVHSQKGLIGFVLGDYSEDKQLTVVTLDNSLNELGRFTVNYDITSIRSDEKFIYLASKGQVEILHADGTPAARVPVNNLQGIEVVGDRLYDVTNAAIDMIDVKAITAPPEESKPSSGKDTSSKSKGSSEKEQVSSEETRSEDTSAQLQESSSEPQNSLSEPQESSQAPSIEQPESGDLLNYDALEPV
ncbi:DUF5711 family protein [Oscillospiraceae bacterium PP1C4]